MASRSHTYNPSPAGKTPCSSSGKVPQFSQAHQTKSMASDSSASQSARKRKVIDLTLDDEEDEDAVSYAQAALAGIDKSKPKRARKKQGEESDEKRLKRFRPKAPQSYLERLERVRTQRMFLIDRNRTTSEDGTHEEEIFDLAGSTGNIYQITIRKVPKCTCPDFENGNQCKHIIYVLVNVLKVRKDLAYQLAFLTTELAEIFANAPVTTLSSNDAVATQKTDTGCTRKPIEGDCPVCVMELDESDKPEDILWCKGACGQNIHRTCFEQWARSKPGQVKCVYCRTPWKGDEDMVKKIVKAGTVNQEGYVNVAGQLGISGHRDMGSYHHYWVRREYGGGYGRGDEYYRY